VRIVKRAAVTPHGVPLSDTRVVECGQVIAGPLVGTFLGDLGADVVKVEPPDGELFRTDRRRLDGEPFNPGFELYNRNKRSLSLDLKRERGRESLHDLVEKADVFVQNWPPGVAENLDADYETLSAINEDLVYVHITGFGETGPLANNPGMDTIVQHMSGFTSLLGDGLEDGPPIRSQSSLADVYAAYSAALSAVAALRRVDRGEGGQKVDVSLLESLIHNLDGAFEYYTNLGEVPQAGGRNTFSRPDMLYGSAEAADGYVVVALLLYSDRIWDACCDLMDRPDLAAAEKYQTAACRLVDASKLSTLFEAWLVEQPADEAVEKLNAAGVPAAHVNDIGEAAELDHLDARDAFVDVPHPRYGEVTLTDTPLSLSETPPSIRRHAPVLGEHSRDVLAELGYDEETVDALLADGVAEQA
jgi:CoA:oxalate CoA-transferase